MAGKFVDIINPGYATLFTKDLEYAANSYWSSYGESNAFDPDDTAFLQEGEFLVLNSDGKLTREATGTVTSDMDNEGTKMPFMYFAERGRYDAQITRKAHVITGPIGFEFRTKMCDSTSLSVGDQVFVCDVSIGGRTYRGLGGGKSAATGDYAVGVVTKVHGTNDISVIYNPHVKA